MNNIILKNLDSYSLLICTKYLIQTEDFINVICVCKKFKETTEKLRFNPIPIKSLKLFPNIQTQHLYSIDDIIIDGIDNYEIHYEVDYDHYLNSKDKNYKYCHVTYTDENRLKYGDVIPNGVNNLSDDCFNTSNIGTITIPTTITSIGVGCFEKCNGLSSVNIPCGISALQDYCYDDCFSLTSINFSSSIKTMGRNCFYQCNSLQTLIIPDSVFLIESGCFCFCTSLTSVTLPSSLSVLNQDTFSFCFSLEKIELPTTLILIGDGCFNVCSNLTKITLPPLLNHIGNNCFTECGIESIEIPKFVKFIGTDCFHQCVSLTNLKLESNIKEFPFQVSYNDSIFYKQFGIECNNVGLTKNDVELQMNENVEIVMKEFIIPNGVNHLFDDSFFYMDSLESIVIPTTVTSIGSNVFRECQQLTQIIIPTTVVSIGNDSFAFCSNLTSLSIPNSVTSIGIGNFDGPTNLSQLSLPLNENNKYAFKLSYSDYVIVKKFNIECELDIIFDDIDYDQHTSIPTDIPLIITASSTNETKISNNIISMKRITYHKILFLLQFQHMLLFWVIIVLKIIPI